MTAKFKEGILDNYIRAEMTAGFSSLYLEVTSDYPIASPITIKYSARGEFIVNIQDEWGSLQPPVLSFECNPPRSETLTVGKTKWDFSFIPDEYGSSKPGLPGGSEILSLDDWYVDMNNFSDKSYRYIKK